MIAETALGRSARQTMLHAIADKALDSSIVQFDGDADDHCAFGLAEPLENAAIQLDLLGGHFQLPAGHLKGRRILKDRNRLMRPIVVGVKDDPMAVRRLGFLIRGGEVGSHELDP